MNQTSLLRRYLASESGNTIYGARIHESSMHHLTMIRYRNLIKRLESHASHFEDLIQKYKQLSEQVRTDTLTELLNRRAFEEEVRQRFAEYRRYGTPLSFMMLDIDHFKSVNDTYGHAAGDNALKAVAQCLKRQLRVSDVAARWGGEEFIVCMQHLLPDDIESIAERIRREISDYRFSGPTIDRLSLTASIGVSFVRPDDPSYEQAIARADKAMYDAKNSGRNSIRVFFVGANIRP